ncbi:hypothetical protein RV15_GL002597 [Enterococcus silesiacus]|uniref:histidine kinase n=1 Tax=Enterococcus silesiacus TaxID=332949 RepID=A0AA91G6N2_9ENTE|nr:hypothetical protein RV15_GL002597 [Enterococcus silesiacus]
MDYKRLLNALKVGKDGIKILIWLGSGSVLFQDLSCVANNTLERGKITGFYDMLALDWLGLVSLGRNSKVKVDGTLDFKGIGDELGLKFIEEKKADLLLENSNFNVFEYKGYFFAKLHIRKTERYEVFYLFCRENNSFEAKELKWAQLYIEKSYDLVLTNNELIQSNNYISNVFDSTDSLILVFDSQLNIVTHNKALGDLNKLYEQQDTLSLSTINLENEKEFEDSLNQVLSRDEKVSLGSVNVTKGKQKRKYSFSLSPFKNSKEQVVGVVAVGSDITKLQMINHELEQLSNYGLMGQIALGLSHDVKNPLSNIRSCAHLVGKPNIEAIQRVELVSIIQQEVDRINQIIEEMMSFNVISKESDFKFLDLNKILLNCKHIIERQKLFKQIEIKGDLEEYLPPFEGQKSDMQQLFLNIMLNAMQSIEDHGVITIKSRFLKEHDQIEISISDTGKGMLKEELDNIGTPYYTTKPRGTGLGLYTAKRIARKYDAKLDIQSIVEKGTTCCIYFSCI